MIIQTLIFSFPDEMTDQDRDGFLNEMETIVRDSGLAQDVGNRRHVRLPEDDYAPVFVASAVAQMAFADTAKLEAAAALPELQAAERRWRERFPYKVVWVNHEPVL